MTVYYLIIITFFLTLCNFTIAKCDFMHPSVLFCGVNWVYSIVCLVITNEYGIVMQSKTVIILISGMLCFTLFNCLSKHTIIRIRTVKNNSITPIVFYKIHIYWIILFVLFEIIVAVFMIKYARDVSRAFYGSAGGFSEVLGRYNQIIKTRGEELSALGVHASIIYTLGWPLCIAVNTLFSAVAINNYIISKKIPFSLIFPYFIMIIMSFLNASRSTAFRFLTQLIVEYFIIHRWHKGSTRKGNIRLFVKILAIGGIAIVILAYSINFIGRGTSIPIFEYVTAYVGGPFVNLDLAIDNDISTSTIFGQETFHHLYSFIGGRLHIPELIYNLHIPYISVKGHYLGNVYTMYYMFIEDFGYWGILPLTSIIAIYYNYSYNRLINIKTRKSCLSLRLLIYGYLFNDLLMLTFSNRFYETALGRQAILFYFFILLVWVVFKQGLLAKKRTISYRLL